MVSYFSNHSSLVQIPIEPEERIPPPLPPPRRRCSLHLAVIHCPDFTAGGLIIEIRVLTIIFYCSKIIADILEKVIDEFF